MNTFALRLHRSSKPPRWEGGPLGHDLVGRVIMSELRNEEPEMKNVEREAEVLKYGQEKDEKDKVNTERLCCALASITMASITMS